MQRCTSDVDTVRLFYREQVIQIAQACSRISIGFPILLWLDWKMALSATALMPVIILFAVIFFSRVQGSFKKTEEAEGIMTATLQENLTGIRVVRAFARQEFEIDRFTKKNANYRDQQLASVQNHGGLLVHLRPDVHGAVRNDRVCRRMARIAAER